MAARMLTETDGTTSYGTLAGLSILFIGYGNQGRAQALNLRDTFSAHPLSPPPSIRIANRTDSYHDTALADGFFTSTNFESEVYGADVVFLLVPDQVQPSLFIKHVAPNLRPGATVVVASGYNLYYAWLQIPEGVSAVMLAPRMIGAGVRSRYQSGTGFPCFVSVETDAGGAWEVVTALAGAVGALRGFGAVVCSARDETLMDLFAEQALWPSIIVAFREAYSTLKALGCSDEALVHELWLSKEPAEVFEKMAEDGFIEQLKLHSTVSQYGQLGTSLTWMEEAAVTPVPAMREFFKDVAQRQILDGEFADEFYKLNNEGKLEGLLEELYAKSAQSELGRGERRVRERLGMKVKTE
ncbi:Acetohydroxy acid isomeroreductase, catalytic domain-containing protein [Geopyxis carbonaria]|nr:Acetohydroxy acid isomeroreductase, catalytic domain-containing protein [Geopyxis carbonaria]